MAEPRTRREPPAFRVIEVVGVEARTDHLTRLTLAGPALAGFDEPEVASSVRLLLPRRDTGGIELPTWNGNEFLDADGARPLLRTLTPLGFDATANAFHVDVVLHGEAPLSTWARTAPVGSPIAVSGPGRGFQIDAGATSFLLAGDESALPAITDLLARLPAAAAVRVLVEVRDLAAQVEVPAHPGAEVTWLVAEPGAAPGSAMVAAIEAAELDDDVRVWAAGEAASVQRIRKHLAAAGVPARHATVRGYWRRDRTGS
jgi:NADPH-dependent ferric siderophore reductase